MGYHFHVDFISRGKGQSLVAKGAYQARTKFREERTGEYKDYTHRPDRPVKSFVFVDKKHGAGFQDIESLLNAIDRAENQANSQTGLNFTAALPKELNDEERARMVRDFGREHFYARAFPPLPTFTRRMNTPPPTSMTTPTTPRTNCITATGMSISQRQREPLARTVNSGRNISNGGITRSFWNTSARVGRKLGARYLENAGHKIEAERWRYGYLTNPEQREKALERGDHEWAEKKAHEAGKHRGPNADAMERKGIETDLGNANREIQQCNEDRATLRALKRDLAKLERQDAFENLKRELTEAEKVLARTREADRDYAKRDPAREQIAASAAKEQEPQTEPNITALLKRQLAEVDKLLYGGLTPDEQKRQLEDLDKFLAAELHERGKKYPNHNRTHWQDQIPPGVAAADADRDYAKRDPAREQIAWEDALAKAAIEKEKKDRQFVERPSKEQQPARLRFGDVLITRAAETAMSDPRQRHGEPLSSAAAFRDALEKNQLALACVTRDEAAKSHRENKFAKELGRYAPVYQAGEIVIVREPRNDGNTAGRVHKLEQTKAEDYLRCLALDRNQLQGIEVTKQKLDDRAQTRQRAIDAAKLRKARSQSRSPYNGGLAAHQIWALQRVRDADQRRREQDRREYSEK